MTAIEDVLIIGAGPVGSYTARALARLNYRVTVLEKRTRLGSPVCCAGIISPGCLAMLDTKNIPLLETFNGARVFSPEGHTLELERSCAQALAVDRGLLDKIMAERAASAGANYIFGAKVNRIESDSKGTTVYTQGKGNTAHKGRMVIAASGFNPLLNSNLNLERPADFAIGVQAKVETRKSLPLCVFSSASFAPGFFSWLEPLGGGAASAGLLCRKNAAAGFDRFIKHLKETGMITSAGNPQYRGGSLAPLKRTYGDRLLVLGDAAGQVKPITGGGILYGLKAADCAIEQIARAFENGDFSASGLAGYQKQWKKVLGKDIQLGRAARRIYERFSERRIENAFRSIMISGLADKLANDEGLKFDDHGSLVLKILTMPAFYRVLASAMAPVVK